MGDVSEFFKSGFLSLHKNSLGKNYQQKTLKDRVTSFNNIRRETRNTLMLQKRQITQFGTPESSKIIKENVKEVIKPSKRLDMLQKWKIDKEKRKQEEKQKAKPVFKVCHVPVEVGLPSFEAINKPIKRKLIKTNVTHIQSQFAPPNHKFKAPQNIKPIHMYSDNVTLPEVTDKQSLTLKNKSKAKLQNEQTEAYNSSVLEDNKKFCNGMNNKRKTAKVPKTIMSKTEEKNQKVIKSTTSATLKRKLVKNMKEEIVTRKQVANLSSTSNKASAVKNNKNKVSEKSGSSKRNASSNINKTPKKNKIDILNAMTAPIGESCVLRSRKMIVESPNSKKSQNSVEKCVAWNQIEVIGDQVICADINKTPKTITKKYNKTPLRIQNFSVSDNEVIGTYPEYISANDQSMTPESNTSTRQLRNSILKIDLDLEQIKQKDDIKSRRSTVGSATGSASPDYPIEKNATEINSPFNTPVKNYAGIDAPTYISPFVTVSRGKTSSRKEYHLRNSLGGVTPDLGKDILNCTSPKAGAEYFSRKLDREIERIEVICEDWNNYKNSNEIPEEANDMIDVAIGQSKLLISKKFQQFRNLIEQCMKYEYVEKPVTCEDLHGFWDMIYMQVEDLNKRFDNLNTLKANNWQEVLSEKKVVVKRGSRGRPKKASASSALANLIKAARNMKKLQTEGKASEKANLMSPETHETKTFNGGYFSINSPIREVNDQNAPTGSARRSLRVALLANKTKNRVSSPPGLTMMKVSKAVKYENGITPTKSILKNDLTKSAKKISKSVLFKDALEEDCTRDLSRSDNSREEINKENRNEINLITFSPITPTRRSKRLSKMN